MSDNWRWSVARMAAAFVALASVAVGISIPFGPMHVVQVAVAALMIALSLFALIAYDVQSVIRIGLATAFAAIAAFGFLTPWALCEWAGTAYVGARVCSPDCDAKETTQRSRLKWAACLAVGAATLMLLPQHIFDGGASSILRMLRTDVHLITTMIGL